LLLKVEELPAKLFAVPDPMPLPQPFDCLRDNRKPGFVISASGASKISEVIAEEDVGLSVIRMSPQIAFHVLGAMVKGIAAPSEPITAPLIDAIAPARELFSLIIFGATHLLRDPRNVEQRVVWPERIRRKAENQVA